MPQGPRREGAGFAPYSGRMEEYRPIKFGTPYADMTLARKLRFIAKLVLCVATFGFAFPNVMFD